MDDPVTQRQRGGDKPVVPGRAFGFLADHQRDLRQHGAPDLGDIVVDRISRSLPEQKLSYGHQSRCP
jgi:hypothetical protein